MTESSGASASPNSVWRDEVEQVGSGTLSGDQGNSAEMIACYQCGKGNSSEHRFCRDCGGALWKECSGCRAQRPVDEQFCVQCGRNLEEAEKEAQAAQLTRLAEIRTQIERLELNEALSALTNLASRQTQPWLQEVRQTTEELITQVARQLSAMTAKRTGCCERAHRLLDEHRYEDAVLELESIPPPLRDESTRSMLSDAQKRVGEIRSLKLRIRQSNGYGIGERVDMIRRLLVLRPSDTEGQRWSADLREHLMVRIRRKIKRCQYRESLELLRQAAELTNGNDLRRIERKLTELDFLSSQIRTAPFISKATLVAAKRLVELAPEDQRAKTAWREMSNRLRAAKMQGKDTEFVEWAPCPDRPHVGVPVHAYLAPGYARFSTPQTEQLFRQRAGQLFVACGLALQGIGQAAMSINLLASQQQGMLAKITRGLRNRQLTAAWGLDVGASALKAVRMVTEGDERRATIDRADYIPHRLPLSAPEARSNEKEIIRETLQKLVSRHEQVTEEWVTLGHPAVRTLVRFLRLPAAAGKRWQVLLEHEVRHQISFPLDEVIWESCVLEARDDAPNPVQRQVLLLAQRKRDVVESAELFQQVGIDVRALQCDAVALHNFVQYDRMENALPDGEPGGSAVLAILDVGHESTNVLFSMPHALWFRAFRPAGDDVSTALVRRFKLTRDAAEQLKRDPAKTKHWQSVHEECGQVFEQIVTQFHRARSAAHNAIGLGPVDELLLVGGGALATGLLHHMRCGR